MPTRRSVLAAAGVAVTSAGCTNVLGDDGEQTDQADRTNPGTSPDPETVRLEELAVQNNHDEAHELQLAVESDGELLHLGTYELDAGGSSTSVEGDWNDAEDSYHVHARLDDREIVSADVTEGVPETATCVNVLVRIDDEGNLGIWNGSCDD